MILLFCILIYLTAFRWYFPTKYMLPNLDILLNATSIWTWLKLFCLCKSKLIAPSFKLSPFTLCTVHTQDKTNWNWVLLIEGFGLFFLIGKNTLSFWIGSNSYCRAIISASILVIKLNFKCICFVSYSHDFSY